MNLEQALARITELETQNKELQVKATESADPSKLTDEQINKVLEDQRIWKTKRLSDLLAKSKIADELTQKQKEAEEAKAKENGEYEKLLEQTKRENEELKESVKQTKIDSAIQAAAVKAGAVDPSVVGKLLDKSVVKVNDDGTVAGVDEAVTALLTASPYLKGNGKPVVMGAPSGVDPATQHQDQFRASQLKDTKFYREHETEIMDAMQKGLIIDDETPAT